MAQEDTQTSQSQNAEEQKTFTQEEVDALIKKRLARAKSDVPADYKELKAKAQKLDELENANKSELQKATEQLEQLKAEVAKRDAADKVKALKAQVSKDTGVPVELISGSTEDEMTSFAEKLVEYAKKNTAPASEHAGSFATAKKDASSIYAQIAQQIK